MEKYSHKVAVWIHIPRLPMELSNATFLKRIGTSLGTMLKIDNLTSIHGRGKYARICVEIDLEEPLASHLIINGQKLFLEYEDLHLICFRCGKQGHKKKGCPEVLVEATTKPTEPPTHQHQATNPPSDEEITTMPMDTSLATMTSHESQTVQETQ